MAREGDVMAEGYRGQWRGGEISLTQISTSDGPDGPIALRLMDEAGRFFFEVHIAPENYAALVFQRATVDCTYRQRWE